MRVPPQAANPVPAPPDAPADETSPRLMAVDALRGFDMLFIVGAGTTMGAIEKMSRNPLTAALAEQLTHVPWEGLRFYDVIFPLFLFIVGVSLVFSLDRALAAGGRRAVLGRVLRRSVLLYALGVFYYGGLSQPWPDIWLGGVLQRIAACYGFAALLYLFVRGTRGLLGIAAALLVGYWALLTFVPIPDMKLEKTVVEQLAQQAGSDSPWAIAAAVPGRVRGSYEEGRNLANFVDFLLLPGYKAQDYYINEGLLSTLPAVALTLFGVLAGRLLRNPAVPQSRKVAWLAAAGLGGILLGLLWSLQFPIIKRIWTSSFILVTGGLSALLLAAFYWLIELKQWRTWCLPFVWVGCNALTIYLLAPIVRFDLLAARLVGGDIKNFLDAHAVRGLGGLVIGLVGLLLALLLMRFLYQRNIFLRV
jgi:predicted acyltransferase